MCRTGLATLAIFYCDFRDTNKQDARNLLSSILIQLCQQSDKFSQVLSSMYSTHGNGSRVPSTDALLGCLKAMLALQGQATLYVVLDAIDECPNSPGLLTRREEVLEIVKELIDLKLPHLCFCVTSRPEIDIRHVLEPLNPYNVSLHNQHGQKEDLERYVKSVVHSDREMRNWPEDVKKLVINTLATKSSGMYVIKMVVMRRIDFPCHDFRFRWAYCQLETLRWCPLRDIPSALKELPRTLDRTYERILQDIPERMQRDAHRIIQWLTVSSRPMRVDELAEVFAINFDAETSGIPQFDPSWRPSNAETAVLSACSTLVSVVNDGSGKVVQFAHFSVKEYLTSDRITNSAPVYHFHVLPNPAHTLLSKACLSVLLQLDYSIDDTKIRNFPLASYAAKHWMDHARFEDVSSHIRHGMDILFDRSKPHLAAWIWLFEVGRYNRSPHPTLPDAAPLYYAALCGIHILVERLLDAHSQDVNSRGGLYRTPLFAALGKEHPDISLLLLERGADVESRDRSGHTALYMSSSRGYSEVVRSLIDRGANLNTGCEDQDDDFNYVKWTPLFVASKNGRLEVAKMLLEHGADVNHQDSYGKSPLHIASRHSSTDLALLLLNHGANHNALDTRERDALHFASSEGQVAVVTLLLKYGMNLDTRSQSGSIPLHYAAMRGQLEVLQLLLDYGTDVNTQNIYRWTALHLSAWNGHLQIAEVLLTLGADLHAQTDQGETPFQLALRKGHTQVARLLLERNDSMWTM
jgi:ankyrin repeat protein